MMQAHTLSNTCRTCMATDVAFLPLFASDQHAKKVHYKSLAECINAFTDIVILKNDGLPAQVCALCARKVIELHNFRQQCINTEKVLRNTFKELPDEVESVIIKPEIALEEDTSQKDGKNVEFSTDIQSDFAESNDSEDIPLNVLKETSKELCKSLEAEVTARNYFKELNEEINTVEIETLPDTELMQTLEQNEETSMNDKVECILSLVDGKQNFQCPMCEVVCPYQTEFDEHLSTHVKKKNQCELCGKAFTKPSHLTRHLYTHDIVKPYNCKECNKGFARLQQYTNHVNMHTGVKPHTCKQCGKGFNQISNLKDHMRTHNGEKPFLCSVCGKGFNQLGNLRQHTIRHSGVKAHLCNICGTGFASKGELGAHTRKHTGAKPFVCSTCNHGFTTSSSLTKHKRIHSGEKPYECEVCKMRFSRSGILSRHRRVHTGEKPYACPHCTRAFAQSNDLSSHLRIHTGERPFVCDICGQAFRQTSALKTHKKIHRKGDAVVKSGLDSASRNKKEDSVVTTLVL